jgi:uncharacterized protein (DUF885 family)
MHFIRTRAALAAAAIAILIAGCAASPAAPVAEVTAAPPAAENARAQAFFEQVFEERLALEPEFAAQLGFAKGRSDWNDISEAGHRARRDLARRQLAALRDGFDPARLDAPTRLSRELLELDLERRIEAYRWRRHAYVFNQMSGLQSSIPAFLINTHRVQDEQDTLAYVERPRKAGAQLQAGIDRAERAARRGVVPPRFVHARVASDAANVIRGRPFDAGPADSPLLADFAAKVAALDLAESRRLELLEAARRALLESVGPGYRAVIAWSEAAAARATADDGAWKLPHGEGYYDYLLRTYTTTDLDAEAIHQLGLREVGRIHGEMRAIMRRVGFEGDLAAFFGHLRDDDRF